jgi:hypothetical protein
MKKTRETKNPCWVRIDRVNITTDSGIPPRTIPGFKICSDYVLRGQHYGRVRNVVNPHTGTKLAVEYKPVFQYLPAAKLSVIPDDHRGLTPLELDSILASLSDAHFSRVEVSFNFPPASGVDREFVLKHAKFGKAQPLGGKIFSILHYGRGDSEFFVRAYFKPEIGAFRVELQLNRSFLRTHRIQAPRDFLRLQRLNDHRYFEFVSIDRRRLSKHLRRSHSQRAAEILCGVRKRLHCLHRALRYLRSVGVTNVHRFLKPLQINKELRLEVTRWANFWRSARG